MAEFDVVGVVYMLGALATAFGIGAIAGFYFGAKTVLRLIGEVQPVVKNFLGGKKMGLWDVAGMLLTQGGGKGLQGLLGGGKP